MPGYVQLVHSALVSTVQIIDTELHILEFQGQRVISLGMIDKVHRRPEGTAGRTLRDHRDKFIQGEDYFVADQPDVIRRLGFSRPQGGLPEKVLLITESGYFMIVKNFTDDLAWRVQRELVRSYFGVRELEVRQPVAPALPNFEDPIAAAEAWIEQAKGRRAAELALLAETQAKAELAAKVEVLEPKAEVHDQIADADGTRSISEAAKVLGTGEKRLFAQLRELKILQANNLPYQHHLDSGHFRVVARTYQHGENRKAYSKTVVTGKGLTYLAKLLQASNGQQNRNGSYERDSLESP